MNGGGAALDSATTYKRMTTMENATATTPTLKHHILEPLDRLPRQPRAGRTRRDLPRSDGRDAGPARDAPNLRRRSINAANGSPSTSSEPGSSTLAGIGARARRNGWSGAPESAVGSFRNERSGHSRNRCPGQVGIRTKGVFLRSKGLNVLNAGGESSPLPPLVPPRARLRQASVREPRWLHVARGHACLCSAGSRPPGKGRFKPKAFGPYSRTVTAVQSAAKFSATLAAQSVTTFVGQP